MSKTSTNQDIINHIYKELEESTESQIFNTNTNENLEISLYKEDVAAILDQVSSIELFPSNGVMDRILNYSISKKICN